MKTYNIKLGSKLNTMLEGIAGSDYDAFVETGKRPLFDKLAKEINSKTVFDELWSDCMIANKEVTESEYNESKKIAREIIKDFYEANIKNI